MPPSTSQIQRGIRGEELLRLKLVEAREEGSVKLFARPEWVVIPAEGDPFYAEAKSQDRFEPPPFFGHGLPVRQAKNYEALRYVTGYRTRLYVFNGDEVFEAWIDELERGHFFDTVGRTGREPRRIYPLESFTRTDARKAA